jgi:hypothetical protein
MIGEAPLAFVLIVGAFVLGIAALVTYHAHRGTLDRWVLLTVVFIGSIHITDSSISFLLKAMLWLIQR